MCTFLRSAVRHCCSHTHRRWAHRAPDRIYLREGMEKNSHFKNQIGGVAATMEKFPKLISNYLKVAAAATVNGKTPLVHAQMAHWSTGRFFTNDLNRSFQKKYPFFSYLRPVWEKDFQVDREVIEDKIEAFCQKNGAQAWTPGSWGFMPSRCDIDPDIRKYLVSTNYALLGNVAQGESAYYFAFNPIRIEQKNNTWAIVEEVVRRSLQMRGVHGDVANELMAVFEKYSNLNVENLFVIAVPREKLAHFAYDSKSFGIPTKEKIDEVVTNPMAYSSRLSGEEGGLQARLMIHKDAMTPASGIDVVCVNEDEEVERYCQGIEMTPPEDVSEYAPFFKHQHTAAEESDRRTRRELRKTIADIAEYIVQKPGS